MWSPWQYGQALPTILWNWAAAQRRSKPARHVASPGHCLPKRRSHAPCWLSKLRGLWLLQAACWSGNFAWVAAWQRSKKQHAPLASCVRKQGGMQLLSPGAGLLPCFWNCPISEWFGGKGCIIFWAPWWGGKMQMEPLANGAHCSSPPPCAAP